MEAQAAGEISDRVDASAFAALVQVQMMGVRSFADAAADHVDMARVVGDSIEMLQLRAQVK